jgi:raffinose/stachyose/melibiose transport system permease protein
MNDWLGQESTALVCAFIPILWQYVGYHMLIMYAGAKSISTDIYEAAKIDGATSIKTAFYITIPLLKPILKVCITFSVIGALKVFDLIYVLTNGGPFHSTEVPSTLMYTTIFDNFQYGYGSAISVFIILECLVLTVLIDRVMKLD